MKSLKNYLIESSQNIFKFESESESKSFTFNFSEIDNGEEIIKSLQEHSCDCMTIEDNKVTLKISKDINIDTIHDILQQSIQDARNSLKSKNNEYYAQKTKKLMNTLNEMDEFINKINNPEEPEEPEESKDKKEEE